MKWISRLLFDSRTTIILLTILIIALGTATFIEDAINTETAQLWIYQAKWLEFLFIVLIINLIGHIFQYKLLSRKKWAGFTFHTAFILIIAGAGITRYLGYEGSMHIREGETSNKILSGEPIVAVQIQGVSHQNTYEFPFQAENGLKKTIDYTDTTGKKQQLKILYRATIPNAEQKVVNSEKKGKEILSFSVTSSKGNEHLLLESGNIAEAGSLRLGFNTPEATDFSIRRSETGFEFTSPSDVLVADSSMNPAYTISKGLSSAFSRNLFYSVKGHVIRLDSLYSHSEVQWISSETRETGTDILVFELEVNGIKNQINYLSHQDQELVYQSIHTLEQEVYIGVGRKLIELPFSLTLNDFILDRYPGSSSPSSYASEVTLSDPSNNYKENHRIFMNNVLDYNQYRFFQTSYDPDEKGTILTVNHDFYGTLVTYTGYGLMILGFILSLMNPHSRFHFLARRMRELQLKRKGKLIIPVLVLLFFHDYSFAGSASVTSNPVSEEHAEKFGELQVQTFDGRFEPMQTLAIDALHKISRKDKFYTAEKGNMNAMQVFLDIILFPDYWQAQNIIYVREKVVRDKLGLKEKYASWNDFFGTDGYKLQPFIEEAFRKKQSEQNTFDKEIIKIDERINIFAMLTKGSLLCLFPDPEIKDNKWIHPADKAAFKSTGIAGNFINSELGPGQLNFRSLSIAYFSSLIRAIQNGNYSEPDKFLQLIKDIQNNTADESVIIPEIRTKTEILYNNLQIFIFLRNLYAVLSLLILLLAFAESLSLKDIKWLKVSLNLLSGILILAFVYHSVGLALRWYLSGHAPWSNGYESLLLVGWGSVLAGLIFSRYSKITLGATGLLAFFVLMTASHSSYDPQLTNLQPVLKSYWLIIHVATLTISYGFLGLGFILGLINMGLMIFRNQNNSGRLTSIISELTSINEMNLTVGIVLATTGTFLGGIWANESWGRYWGWDAKETWALIIVLVYTLILHLRFIPKFSGMYAFNLASVLGFGSVLMTFIGVNYYFTKGLHSYGAGDTPAFPVWAWILIILLIFLLTWAGLRNHFHKSSSEQDT
jgi:cytochrome c-type biogenesis protein CcsB